MNNTLARMENYDEFIQKQVSRIKSNEIEEYERVILYSKRPSNITFYGLPVLPPLLNKDQREELQKIREEATHLLNKRKRYFHMPCIETVLDSVQLRQAPTFEEFTNETGISKSITCNPVSKHACDETIGSHWTSSSDAIFPCAQQTPSEKVLIALSHPLTSTAFDGHTALNLRPLDKDVSLENSHTALLFEGISLVGHKSKLNTDCRFGAQSLSQLHHIDISHQGLSSGYVTIETSDISSSSIEGTRVEATAPHSDFAGLFSDSLNSTGNIISHAPVDGEVLEECTSSNQAQPDVTIEPVNPPVVPDPTEGPYNMSLQNLLKKSQEHRQRQRLLRNQAKTLKASEAEQADQHSHSDKENEEFFPTDTGKNDLKKIRDKLRDQGKSQLIISQTQTQREDIVPCELKDLDANKFDVSFVYGLSNASSSNNTGTAFSSHPDMTASLPQPTLAAPSLSAKSLYKSKGTKTQPVLPKPCQAVGKKFKNMPTPKFCLSPDRSKKGRVVSVSFRKPLVKTPVSVDEETRPDSCSQSKSAVSMLAGTKGDMSVCRSKNQAEQIAQLELNLSSLKVLISDLESTLSKSQTHFAPTEAATVCHSSQQTLLAGNECAGLPDGVKSPCTVTFCETLQQQEAIDHRAHCVTSIVQKLRVPEAFQHISDSKRPSPRSTILADASNQSTEKKNASGERKNKFESLENVLNGSALNLSYDVDTPSGFWSQAGHKGIQLTPELGGQEGVSRAKRRLLMNTVEIKSGQQGDDERPQSSTPKVASQWPDLQLRQGYEAQVKVLVDEQSRQQQELLQSLATRYQFLQSVSFMCPSKGSRLEDVATSLSPSSVSMGLGSFSQPTELTLAELSIRSDSLHISQSSSCLPVYLRPLVAAAVKGYLTRRLLRTERVAQLIRTIKDTQLFLKDLRSQTPGREYTSRQDQVLQERVVLQLQAARYELHDLFCSLGPADRMQVISWDRDLARERKLKHKKSKEPQPGGKCSISAATRKALERKRTVMLQKKTAERTKQVLGLENSSFLPNPCRVPKKAHLCHPR